MNSRSLRRARRRARVRKAAVLMLSAGILALWSFVCATRFPDHSMRGATHALQGGAGKL
jgi:hypothetical protein